MLALHKVPVSTTITLRSRKQFRLNRTNHRGSHARRVDTVSTKTIRYPTYSMKRKKKKKLPSQSHILQNFSATPPREFSPTPKFTTNKNMLDDEIVAYIDRSLQSYKDVNTYRPQTERYSSSNDLNQSDFYYEHNRRNSNFDDYDRV